MIKLLMVDDHPSIIDGISGLLEDQPDITIVGKAYNGLEALEFLSSTEQLPNLVLLDIRMPELDGKETLRRIKVAYPEIKVLVLSTFDDAEDIEFMLTKGASGFILKNVSRSELIHSIEKVHRGDVVINEELALKARIHKKSKDLLSINLTRKEKEIVQLIYEEKTTEEIAQILGVSKNTVESHKKNIYIKLDVSNLIGMVKKAVKLKIVEPE